VAYQSEARKIVEAALREALALRGDPGNWLDLPLDKVLPGPTAVEVFWKAVLQQVRIRERSSRALIELSRVKPESLLQETGQAIVNLINETINRDSVEDEGYQPRGAPELHASLTGPEDEAEKNSEPALSSGHKFDEEFAQALQEREMPSPASAEPASPGEAERIEEVSRSEGPPPPASQQHSLHEPGLDDYVAPPPPPPPRRPDNASLVRIFYATDRRKIHDWSDGPQYNFERSELGKLQYGKCTISIPKIHKMGKLESPSLLKLEFRSDPEKHIVLTYTTSLEEELYFEQVRAYVAKSPKKEAFVFVHGYNVSFEDAARRTGQIAFDLGFIGAPIFYSWPSNDKIADYIKDETNITWSTPHFQRFLTLLSQNSGAERIHIIAHSMGNRAVCDALKALSYDPSNRVKFNHLVLAAPDIDAETFQELATLLQRLAARITLYESSKDKALFASKKIHGNARAGEPLLIIPGLDTIDASLIDTDFLGHSYFSESWPLLSDIHSLLFNDELASQRFGLTTIDTKDGEYYAFRK
jgi:esterase/lipase superfamily enzyme